LIFFLILLVFERKSPSAINQKVYDELRKINDPDIHYATFKLDDGQTFVHIASFASEEKKPILTESAPFKVFQEGLKERCEVPPNPQRLNEVSTYNFV
jgi:hypothetical protein